VGVAGNLVVVGEGRLGAVVQFFRIPHGSVLFQKLKDFLQNDSGVSGKAYVLQLEVAADGFGGCLF
jgi:hypothetical protein